MSYRHEEERPFVLEFGDNSAENRKYSAEGQLETSLSKSASNQATKFIQIKNNLYNL